MKKTTFSTFKSTNLTLHNKISQQQQYHGYLRRIQRIVDRKYNIDHSPELYMTFLNRSRQVSKHQNQLEKTYLIQLQNKHLLNKIQREKSRDYALNNSQHEIRLFEKRVRQQERINEENAKLAERIMNSSSYLVKKKFMQYNHKLSSPNKGITKQRQNEVKFYDSRIKNRKLPKLTKETSPNSDDTKMIR